MAEGTVLMSRRVWLVMDDGRTVVAKGTPRSRNLVRVDDKKDRKRCMTYNSRGMAEIACRYWGQFFPSPRLVPVAADMLIVIPPERKADRFKDITEEMR